MVSVCTDCYRIIQNMKRFIKVIFAFSLLFCLGHLFFAAEDTDPVPYEEGEFPQWAYDLRRTEIITLGSMPFVSIGVTLGYGAFLMANGEISSFPNPFSSSSSVLSSDQVRNIFLMTIGISTIYGITDFIINYVKRKNSQQQNDMLQKESNQFQVRKVTPEEAARLLNDSMSEQTQSQEDSETDSISENQSQSKPHDEKAGN